MEQIAQAERGRSRWRREWSVLGLAALMLVVLIANYRIGLWALADLVAGPLTFLAVPALLLLPGLALLRWLWPHPLHPAERWSLALGISAGLPPLLFLLSEPIGLRWNTWLCWAYLLLAALALCWPARGSNRVFRSAKLREETRKHDLYSRDFGPRGRPLRGFLTGVPGRLNGSIAEVAAVPVVPEVPDRQRWELQEIDRKLRAALDFEHLLLIGMTLIALAVQLYAVRDLPVGMFGDSYHHTIIAQLMVDHGGLFSSWRPYAPLTTFTYHYGFHSLVAWLYWLSGTPVTRGLLIIGQVEIALTVPLVYVLTRRALGDGRAALWAALLAGFVSAMPAYYVNWGRYTQLGGQAILPAACICWAALFEAALDRQIQRGMLFRLVALTVIVTAGIILTHYRVAVFAACFVAAFGIYLLCAKVRSWRVALNLAGIACVTLILTIIVVVPYLVRLQQGLWLKLGGYLLSNNIGTDMINGLSSLDVVFGLYAKWYLVGLACLGGLLLALRRHWQGLSLVAWGAVLLLGANPYLLGLNGAGILSNFAIQVASYLLLAPLGGAAIAQIWNWGERWRIASAGTQPLQIAIGLLVILWGIGWQQRIVSPDFQLCMPADMAAAEWIRHETPADAMFFVNSFPAYGNSLYAGSDCGWWLPLLSRRASNLPPILYGVEVGEQRDYVSFVHALNVGVERFPIASPEAVRALKAAGFQYLYDGPAASPPPEYFNAAVLQHSTLYERVYNQGGVSIWKIK